MTSDHVDNVTENTLWINRFVHFVEKMVKYLVTYVTKCFWHAILKTISIKCKIVNFKKHLPTVVQTSKTLYCYQFSDDFTYFMFLTRQLCLRSWLTFRENGPFAHIGPKE